jgi:hypothetical protein
LHNSENSIAASLSDILASTIPLHSTRDGEANHETPQEVKLRLEHEVQVKLDQEKMFGLLEVVILNTGQRIHDLRDSFNLIVSGSLRDEMEQRDYGPYCAVADWPV